MACQWWHVGLAFQPSLWAMACKWWHLEVGAHIIQPSMWGAASQPSSLPCGGWTYGWGEACLSVGLRMGFTVGVRPSGCSHTVRWGLTVVL